LHDCAREPANHGKPCGAGAGAGSSFWWVQRHMMWPGLGRRGSHDMAHTAYRVLFLQRRCCFQGPDRPPHPCKHPHPHPHPHTRPRHATPRTRTRTVHDTEPDTEPEVVHSTLRNTARAFSLAALLARASPTSSSCFGRFLNAFIVGGVRAKKEAPTSLWWRAGQGALPARQLDSTPKKEKKKSILSSNLSGAERAHLPPPNHLWALLRSADLAWCGSRRGRKASLRHRYEYDITFT
jgi:hypothetical protein